MLNMYNIMSFFMSVEATIVKFVECHSHCHFSLKHCHAQITDDTL